MGTAAKPTRANRTITVDFRDDATYYQLLGDGKAFVECVLAFLLSIGFQLAHKASCSEGGSLRATPIMSASVWAGSLSGGSSAPRVTRYSRSCPTSSCVTARCDQTWPVM